MGLVIVLVGVSSEHGHFLYRDYIGLPCQYSLLRTRGVVEVGIMLKPRSC